MLDLARRSARISPLAFVLALGVALSVEERSARADEPVAAGEPRLMSETGEITSVVDAFDKDDPFDLNLMVGFRQSWKHANIRRETSLFQPGLSTGGFTARTENVASYSQSRSILDLGADIGVFRDLAVILRLPLILSDSRELGDLNGSTNNPQRLQDPSGAQMFNVPFKSPNRSGIDWFSVGADWAIMNQQRDFTKPTWVIGVEGRFGVGPRLHACNANAPAGTPQCPDPADWDPTTGSYKTGVSRDPGISRGMNSIAARTVVSRRYGYVEPYSGFTFLAEFPQSNSDFGATNDFQGALVNHPPLQGTFLMGLEVIPWEHREQFQRLVADFRFKGTYVSPGREYSELFDALGSSSAPSLRNPNPGGYCALGDPSCPAVNPNRSDVHPGDSVANPASQKAYFTGITDQQAYGSFTASGEVTWQAGEYIKFTAGLGLTYNQSHLVTTADACNPDFKGDVGTSGPCKTNPTATSNGTLQQVTGIPNPNHRDAIDLPGRRFSVDDTTIIDLWLRGIVMF